MRRFFSISIHISFYFIHSSIPDRINNFYVSSSNMQNKNIISINFYRERGKKGIFMLENNKKNVLAHFSLITIMMMIMKNCCFISMNHCFVSWNFTFKGCQLNLIIIFVDISLINFTALTMNWSNAICLIWKKYFFTQSPSRNVNIATKNNPRYKKSLKTFIY